SLLRVGVSALNAPCVHVSPASLSGGGGAAELLNHSPTPTDTPVEITLYHSHDTFVAYDSVATAKNPATIPQNAPKPFARLEKIPSRNAPTRLPPKRLRILPAATRTAPNDSASSEIAVAA